MGFELVVGGIIALISGLAWWKHDKLDKEIKEHSEPVEDQITVKEKKKKALAWLLKYCFRVKL